MPCELTRAKLEKTKNEFDTQEPPNCYISYSCESLVQGYGCNQLAYVIFTHENSSQLTNISLQEMGDTGCIGAMLCYPIVLCLGVKFCTTENERNVISETTSVGEYICKSEPTLQDKIAWNRRLLDTKLFECGGDDTFTYHVVKVAANSARGALYTTAGAIIIGKSAPIVLKMALVSAAGRAFAYGCIAGANITWHGILGDLKGCDLSGYDLDTCCDPCCGAPNVEADMLREEIAYSPRQPLLTFSSSAAETVPVITTDVVEEAIHRQEEDGQREEAARDAAANSAKSKSWPCQIS